MNDNGLNESGCFDDTWCSSNLLTVDKFYGERVTHFVLENGEFYPNWTICQAKSTFSFSL